MKARIWVSIGAVAAVIAMSGCASTAKVKAEDITFSGFLDNYEQLKPVEDRPLAYFYLNPKMDLANYDRVMLLPIAVTFHENAKGKTLQPENITKMTQMFHDTIVENLEDRYPMVDEPAADVIIIRAAITDLDSANPVANLITKATIKIPLDMGRANVEAEFLDGETNERMAAIVDARRGSHFTTGYDDVIDKWDHAKEAFEEWAEYLRQRMDIAHGYLDADGKLTEKGKAAKVAEKAKPEA